MRSAQSESELERGSMSSFLGSEAEMRQQSRKGQGFLNAIDETESEQAQKMERNLEHFDHRKMDFATYLRSRYRAQR